MCQKSKKFKVTIYGTTNQDKVCFISYAYIWLDELTADAEDIIWIIIWIMLNPDI